MVTVYLLASTEVIVGGVYVVGGVTEHDSKPIPVTTTIGILFTSLPWGADGLALSTTDGDRTEKPVNSGMYGVGGDVRFGFSSGRSSSIPTNGSIGVDRGYSTWANVRSRQHRTFRMPGTAQIERRLSARGHAFNAQLGLCSDELSEKQRR